MARKLLSVAAMHMRDSLVLTSLFLVTACPPPSPATTADPDTTDGSTADTGEPSSSSTAEPTTGTTTDTTSGTTTTTDTTAPTSGMTASTTDSTTDTTATTGEPQPLLHETCAELHAEDPGAGDGEYTLYVGKDPNKPWTVYCHDMAGTPKEYLPLVNVQEGHNFSQYTASDPEHTDVRTTFTRVRIDPIALTVDIDDLTFSSSTGMVLHGGPVTSMPYAVAEGCAGPGVVDGVANVDLGGTPFKVIDPFCTKGSGASGKTVFSNNNQVVEITGGGNCGWTGPTKDDTCVFDPQNKNSGFVLELEYLPPLHETCAEVKAEQPDAADGEYTLYFGGNQKRPWTVYCHDMATDPKDYLPLVNVQDGHNFSQYTASAQGQTSVRTTFTRVRIDPITLVVNIDDLTFSESTGMVLHGGPVTSMPYAVAEDCAGPGKATGIANIDLVGTKFAVSDPFCTKGAQPAGGAVFSAYDQVVDLTGGGNCGWTGPTKGDACVDNPQNKSSGFVLELVYFNP